MSFHDPCVKLEGCDSSGVWWHCSLVGKRGCDFYNPRNKSKLQFSCHTDCKKAFRGSCSEPEVKPEEKRFLRAGDRCSEYVAPQD